MDVNKHERIYNITLKQIKLKEQRFYWCSTDMVKKNKYYIVVNW
jgi:hypothetical protein